MPDRVTPETPFRETGNTDRASFRRALARGLGGRPSPMAPEADAVYDALAPLGLTRLGAAICWIERHNDTDPDGERFYPHAFRNAWAVKTPPAERATAGTWRRYGSYAEAAADWGRYLLGPTYADRSTLAELIARYAPAADGNDPAAHAVRAAAEIEALPLAAGDRPGGVDVGRVPRPANIVADFVDKPEGMGWSDLGPRRFAGVVLHRVQGRARFTVGHFRNLADPHGRDALTDWGADAAAIYDWNDPDGRGARRSPWASDGPGPATGDGAAFERAHGPGAVNRDTEAIEIDGYFDEPVDAATLENLVALIAWRVDARGRIPWHVWPKTAAGLQAIYWHDEFQTEKPCPGRTVKTLTPLIIERVRERLRRYQTGGAEPPPAQTFPGLPAAMPAEVFARLFPEADPAGPVTRELLAWCAEVGFVPRFNGRVALGDGTIWWDFNPLHLGSEASGRVWRMAPGRS